MVVACEPVFHLFPQLPPELREQIWLYCVPLRVVELDIPDTLATFDRILEDEPEYNLPCSLEQTTYMNNRPPVLSRVCHESRCVALKTGTYGHVQDFLKDLPEASRWDSGAVVWMGVWLGVQATVHLNWSMPYDAQGGGGRSLVGYHDPNVGAYSWPEPFVDGLLVNRPPSTRVLSPEEKRDMVAFKLSPKWLVVMRTFVVHCDVKTAAGHFGLLGDARVQVVDVSEEARIESLLRLAETCEARYGAKVSQKFNRHSAQYVIQSLRAVIMDVYDDPDLLHLMRPAIMFRLCTSMCNGGVPIPFHRQQQQVGGSQVD